MDDTLIHLVWKERAVANSKIPEDDLIVFEGDCSVRLIKQLPDHRVFLVRWNQTNTRKIYWMQHTDKRTRVHPKKTVAKKLRPVVWTWPVLWEEKPV